MSLTQRRLAGLVVPLFSIRTAQDWGVGEFPAFPRFAPVLKRAGMRVMMTLPLLEPSPGQESPYSPVSAFALDPLYIALEDVPEMVALGGVDALSADEKRDLAEARGAFEVRHDLLRPLKKAWLSRCFKHFQSQGDTSSSRALDYARFKEEHAHWLGDYALFRTLKDHYPQSWRKWPEALRTCEKADLKDAAKHFADEIEGRKYVQWLAFSQLRSARKATMDQGVYLGGDEPFLVADDSADVWANQHLYRFDATVGAPPDAFSATGQDWGLPPYRWDRIAEDNYQLFRRRGEHAAKLFDLVRIDHVVGLYRTYHRPIDGGECYFVPSEESAQKKQGEAVLKAFAEAGTALIAEDLGVIPDFVRESLWALVIPGFRVLRWEQRDGKFRLPASWPDVSVATNGTHDTETSAVWWDELPEEERVAIREIPELAALPEDLTVTYNRHVQGALMASLYGSPSNTLILPIQDVFGLRERINVPNTVGPQNWSWRLPWSVDVILAEPQTGARLDELAALSETHHR